MLSARWHEHISFLLFAVGVYHEVCSAKVANALYIVYNF